MGKNIPFGGSLQPHGVATATKISTVSVDKYITLTQAMILPTNLNTFLAILPFSLPPNLKARRSALDSYDGGISIRGGVSQDMKDDPIWNSLGIVLRTNQFASFAGEITNMTVYGKTPNYMDNCTAPYRSPLFQVPKAWPEWEFSGPSTIDLMIDRAFTPDFENQMFPGTTNIYDTIYPRPLFNGGFITPSIMAPVIQRVHTQTGLIAIPSGMQIELPLDNGTNEMKVVACELVIHLKGDIEVYEEGVEPTTFSYSPDPDMSQTPAFRAHAYAAAYPGDQAEGHVANGMSAFNGTTYDYSVHAGSPTHKKFYVSYGLYDQFR